MSVSESQRAAADKWDAKNMSYQTVKVSKALLTDFKAACAARGDRVNTVLREAMERYVSETSEYQRLGRTEQDKSAQSAAE